MVLTLFSQVSRQYFMMLDGIYFICSYLNSLFSKTGSLVSNFVFLDMLGPQCCRSPHNAVCHHPSPVRQDQFAQTTIVLDVATKEAAYILYDMESRLLPPRD